MADDPERPGIRLRPFALADAEAVEVWLRGPGIQVPPGRAGRQWAIRMLADPRILARTGLLGTEPVAFGRFDVAPDRSAELTLAVDPRRRRRGIGREILRQMLGEARSKGIVRVCATVDRQNTGACGFFLANGFEEDGPKVGGHLRLVRVLHGTERARPLEIEV